MRNPLGIKHTPKPTWLCPLLGNGPTFPLRPRRIPRALIDAKPAVQPNQTDVNVTNPDEPGMGHASMGWRADYPSKFFSAPAERNKGSVAEVLVRVLGGATKGLALEIGSGSGQHVSLFASLLPNVNFQPTEYPGHPNPRADVQDIDRILNSIREYCKELPNVLEPAALDASQANSVDPQLAWDLGHGCIPRLGVRDWIETWLGMAFSWSEPDFGADRRTMHLTRSTVVPDSSLDALIVINVIHLTPEHVLNGVIKGAAGKLKPGGAILFYGPFSHNGVISGEGNKKFQATLKGIDPAYGLRDVSEIERKADLLGIGLSEEVFFEESNNYVLILRKR